MELLMSFTILSIGALGFVGAFLSVSKSIHVSKTRAVASNLLQEKVESMKNISYYRLTPTTAAVTSTESGIPAFQYDPGFYPSETITVGEIQYIRRVFVEKVSSAGAGNPTPLGWQDPDSGLKRIRAHVLWQDLGRWKMNELQNLRNNPSRQFMNGRVAGTVAVTSGSPQDAVVMVAQNASWFDTASSAGAYGFYVTPGTYTLTATKVGYFPQTVQGAYVATSSTYSWSPTLTRMSSGTVTGTAYLRDHLVISRVVGSTFTGTFDEEYVELYNPTTFTWTAADLSLFFHGKTTDPQAEIEFTPLTASIAPYTFYLFANTTTVHAGGSSVAADAVWEQAAGGPNDLNAGLPRFNPGGGDPNAIAVYEDGGGGLGHGVGGLKLVSASWGVQDRFGWKGGGGGTTPNADVYEGTPYDHAQTQGLNQQEEYRRHSLVGSYSAFFGPSYDTGNNDLNWDLSTPPSAAPRNSATFLAPAVGTPASGAYVSADDGLSTAVSCASDGTFSLVSVATGTWTVSLSSAPSTVGYFISVSTTISSNGDSKSVGVVSITSSTADGFVTGVVRAAQSNALLSGITVQSLSGAVGVSGASGRYSVTTTPGLTSITANPGNVSNASYVSDTINNVSVTTGAYTAGVDFTLDTGGKLRGYVTIGGNPLPGIPVTATDGFGGVGSEAATDASGYFSLTNLSTGSYTVALQLESGETYSPGATAASLTTAGSTVFVASFSVTSAFGYITGSLATVAGLPIKTGVLVVASTSAISGSYPPDIDSAVRTGTAKYYTGSSLSDGTYEIYLPGGNPGTPITYNVYAWYTTWSGTTPTVTKKSGTAAVTGAATTTGVNFSW